MTKTTTASTRVAAKVREAMRERGVNRVALAEATAIHPATLQRRLAGVTPFTVAELSAIAKHLGMKPSELLAAI